MEQPRYLIDTNAVSDYLGKKPPSSGMDFMNRIIDVVPNSTGISRLPIFSPPHAILTIEY